MNTNGINPSSALDMMLRWNHYCDKHDREGDCILLNTDKTYEEAFESREQALKEIVNSGDPLFKRNEGFLVPLWSDLGHYAGMRYVPESEITNYIDLSLI